MRLLAITAIAVIMAIGCTPQEERSPEYRMQSWCQSNRGNALFPECKELRQRIVANAASCGNDGDRERY